MKYLKLFENFKDIDSICRRYCIENYTINSDGSIDVNGDVDLFNEGLTKLPLKFRNVKGNFYCYDNRLISLEGAPNSVTGEFNCNNNKLISLEGAPQSVGGYFDCSNNKLLSLDNFPKLTDTNHVFYYTNNPCTVIYRDWINWSNKSDLLDMMYDYDFIRGEEIIWDLAVAFYKDAGLDLPNKLAIKEYYKIID